MKLGVLKVKHGEQWVYKNYDSVMLEITEDLILMVGSYISKLEN